MTIRAWWSRLRGTLRRDDTLDRDMEREMAFHLEMSTRKNVQRGMDADAAARHARLSFGSMDSTREAAREAHRSRGLENVAGDVRFALRALRRAPTFAVATLLTMALGIGASTAIFTVVDAVMLRPLPIPQPGDFTYLGWVWAKGGDIPSLTSFQYQFVRDNGRVFSGIATYQAEDARLGGTDAATAVRGLRVGGDFFRTIGFTPIMGRPFDSTEVATGDPSVVILGDAVWRTRFGADSNVIGRRISLDDTPRTVIGVMPADFRFPPSVDHDGYLVPLAVHADPADEGHNTEAIARLRHGTSAAERDADVRALSDRFRAAYPTLAAPREGFKLFSHRDVTANDLRGVLFVLLAAVSLLLLIACANTATLLLVRASSRQREIAVRASIGAGPRRILQQLLTEGFVLAALSAVLGLALGAAALRAFLALAPNVLPAGADPRLDGRAVTYALLVSAATGVVFGLAAAMPSFRLRLHSGVLSGARAATGGGGRARETLVFLETASAVVLLAGATVLITSFARLISVDPGFEADRVLALRLGQLPSTYDATRRDALVTSLLQRVQALPGVERASAATSLPMERGMNFPTDTHDHPELGVGATELRFVSPGYFATLGVTLAGRDFTANDASGGEPVAIVNRTFARHFWGSESPVGRSIQIGHFRGRWLAPKLTHETVVVGVADDMHELGLDKKARPTVLIPRTQQFDNRPPVLLVRGSGTQLAATLRREALAEEPQLSPTVEPLSAVVSRSVAGPRFRALLIASFAGSALLLAGIGIYGVIAALVEQRRREIGIRLSLGATRSAVTVGVARRCMAAVAAGSVVGLLGFWAVRRSLTSMVYDTSTSDPRLLVVVLIVVAITAAAAAWMPARRAALVDPAITLRLE